MKNLLFVLLVIVDCAHAQSTFFTFNKADQFLKQTKANLNSSLQNGDQTLDLETYLAVTELYTVEDVSDSGYVFVVTIKKIVDSISALGLHANYNSEMLSDTNSVIEKTLKDIIKRKTRIRVNRNGIISSVEGQPTSHPADLLVTIINLGFEQPIVGNTLGLVADFVSGKGENWKNSTAINGRKTTTAYKIDSRNDATTTIKFTSEVSENYLSSNINGVLVVNNGSGIVSERLTQSIDVGYQLINDVFCSVARNGAVSESYKKL